MTAALCTAPTTIGLRYTVWSARQCGAASGALLGVFAARMHQVSNLNRQFLFRAKNVGQPKSVTAGEAATAMNPEFRVNAMEEVGRGIKLTQAPLPPPPPQLALSLSSWWFPRHGCARGSRVLSLGIQRLPHSSCECTLFCTTLWWMDRWCTRAQSSCSARRSSPSWTS